jgi:hypothetical protein
LIFLAACTADSSTASSQALATPKAAVAATSLTTPAQIEKDLATLRRTVAPFRRFGEARESGWSTKITSCMSDATLGGMGFHYGKVGFIDGVVRPDQPELLVYEPQADGKLRFVAVEFVIPYTFHARSDAAPVLFGREFSQNDRFQLWGLHVWVGADNPNGLFTAWNPRVSCKYTTDLDMAAMSH